MTRIFELSVRIDKLLPCTQVEGPGNRACIWVQGCSIQCPGCAVPWTWPRDGGTDHSVEELAETLMNGPEIEGVTFMGGEPFEQAAELAALAERVREAGLSIVTFSGYEFDVIERSTDAGWRSLLAATDLLIAGPYIKKLTNFANPWVGSSNQTYHFLTPRYRHLEGRLSEFQNGVEIRIRPDGGVFINGMADIVQLHDLASSVASAAGESTSVSPEDLASVSETG
jgi:anaerobic ribonucleoside-triphosphate reductase activating protein